MSDDMPSDQSYEQLVERVAQLADNTEEPVRSQHVVSKVLLKQFARPFGHGDQQTLKLCRFNLARGTGREVTPAGAGYVEHFVTVAPRSAEAVWQTVETRLHDAIEACQRGSVFDEPEHVDTIKDTLALHFARSQDVKEVHEAAVRDAIANGVARIRANREELMRAEWVKVYNEEPTEDDLESFAQVLNDRAVQALDKEAYFRANVERLFDIARENITNRALEVSRPVSGEFLIGDVPALLLRAGSEAVGIRGGIGLLGAGTIAMPLGPKLMASTGDVAGYLKQLPLATVRYVNRKQVESAISHVHFRIGSRLEEFIRSVPRPPAS